MMVRKQSSGTVKDLMKSLSGGLNLFRWSFAIETASYEQHADNALCAGMAAQVLCLPA